MPKLSVTRHKEGEAPTTMLIEVHKLPRRGDFLELGKGASTHAYKVIQVAPAPANANYDYSVTVTD